MNSIKHPLKVAIDRKSIMKSRYILPLNGKVCLNGSEVSGVSSADEALGRVSILDEHGRITDRLGAVEVLGITDEQRADIHAQTKRRGGQFTICMPYYDRTGLVRDITIQASV